MSRTIADCDLEHLARQPIDVEKAAAQHQTYERALTDLGARLVSIPPAHDLPDAVFVEDPALVLDELAIITRMHSPRRRLEAASVAETLAQFRRLEHIRAPGTLEGGDVMRIGRSLFVGLSNRTNPEGISQLASIAKPLGYKVHPVEMRACLHLKSGCCFLGRDTILANRAWIDPAALEGYRILDVPAEEPSAANVLAVGKTVLSAQAFPATAEVLTKAGWQVRLIDNSELRKAEAGLTCTSLLFETTLPY